MKKEKIDKDLNTAAITTEKGIEVSDRFDSFSLPVKIICLLFSSIGIVLAILYIFGLYPMMDVTYYFLLMALFLSSSYLILPAHAKEKTIAWYSYVLAALSFGVTLFLATQGFSIATRGWVPVIYEWQFYLALILYLLILEASRRAGGTIFMIVVLFFSLYPLIAHLMPGIFWGPPSDIIRTMSFNIYSVDGLLGVVTRILGEVLIGYLIFAALIVATGAADFFLKLAMAIFGQARGATAKVAVVSSGFFGSLSGSIFANVIGTGSVTIPAMKKSGISSHYAAALEACASTGGMLMPPVMGALAFIMADFTGMGYATIAIAAIIPSLLYYFGLYCHIDSFAAKRGLLGIADRKQLPSIKETLKEGWPYLLVLFFLVWALVYMRWERMAPFYAAALLMVVSFFRKDLRWNPQRVYVILKEVCKLLSQTFALLLPTTFIVAGMMATGVAPNLTSVLIRLGADNLVLVLAIGTAICFLFGMAGMMVAAYLMLALTLAPAIVQLGHLNVVAVHLFIAYYALLSAITPPVAVASFIASRISGSHPMTTSITSARLGIVLYIIPIFFLFEPALIFQGPLYLTGIWFFFNVVAVVLIAGASEGYLYAYGNLKNWTRPVIFISGILIAFPEWWTTIIGLIILGAFIAIAKIKRDIVLLESSNVVSSTVHR